MTGNSRKGGILEAPAIRAMALPRYVRIGKFAEMSGYTQKAIYRKIEDGVWVLGHEYRRAPDGNLCIDIEGYERWVESLRAALG